MKNLLEPRPQARAPRRGPSARRPRPGTRLLVEALEDRSCPDAVTLNYVDSGWWNNTGFHDSINKNYFVGQSARPATQYRNFFVFDLSAVPLPIIGAQLRLFNPPGGYSSPDPNDTYTLFDVSTPIPTLRAFGGGQTQIFDDLGSGVSLGAQVVSNADNGHVIPIDLNADAVSYLNAHRGGLVALGGALTTIACPADRYLFSYTGDPTDTRQLVLDLASTAGPYVVSSTPAGNVFGVTDSVRVTFNEEIDPATFTPDKVDSFTRTDGSGVTDLLPTVTGVTAVAGSGGRQFDISFASQFHLGRYALTIGPDIRDLAGNEMDQDLNGITGEVPDDQYTATFTLQGPRIIASTPTGNTLGPVGNVRVTFNEPVNPSTFTTGQVSFSGPGGPIGVTGVLPVAGSNNTQFVVTFTPQSATGLYAMQIGPDVQDLYGHLMDQNQNFIEGEDPGDIYTAAFDIQLSFGPAVNYDTGVVPTSVAVADFDRDGIPDLAVANYTSRTVSVLLGNGDGSFRAAGDYHFGGSPRFVTAGDFNRDGKPDLLVMQSDTGDVSLLRGNGDGTFQDPVTVYNTPELGVSLAVGDFNRDGKLDLVVVNFGGRLYATPGSLDVLPGNGDGTFGPPVKYAVGGNPTSVAVGDFDRDGIPDLAVTRANAHGVGDVAVLRGNGDGTFGDPSYYFTGDNAVSIVTADFNRDGIPDLAVANPTRRSVQILLGNGDGSFRPQREFNVGPGRGPGAVAVGDFNRDGIPDLVTANLYGPGVSVLLGKGDGSFQDAVTYNTGSGPDSGAVAVAVADFDRDGIPDLVVANAFTDNVSVLLNEGEPPRPAAGPLSFANPAPAPRATPWEDLAGVSQALAARERPPDAPAAAQGETALARVGPAAGKAFDRLVHPDPIGILLPERVLAFLLGW
jgi:hypothetical protein